MKINELDLGKYDKKPPVRKTKKTPTVKETGKKRKKELPSSGGIKKYFTTKQDHGKEDIMSGEVIADNR